MSAIPYLGFRLLNVELSADGSRALANFDQPSAQRDVVAIYDVATGKQLLRREAKRPETLSFIGEAISPDGKHVAIAEMDAKANSSVRVLAVDGAEALWQLKTGPGDVKFFPDGKNVLLMYLLADGPPGTRRLIAADIATGKPAWQFDTRDVQIGALTISNDGTRVLVITEVPGPAPDPLGVFDLAKRKKLADLREASWQRLADTFGFAADTGDVVGYVAHRLIRWNSTTGEIIQSMEKLDPVDRDAHATFSPDGRRFYLCTGNELSVRDTKTGALVHRSVLTPGTELKAVSNKGIVAIRVFSSLRFIRLPVGPRLQ